MLLRLLVKLTKFLNVLYLEFRHCVQSSFKKIDQILSPIKTVVIARREACEEVSDVVFLRVFK